MADVRNLLHLASPALPVGAHAHSQGFESAVELGWVRDEASLRSPDEAQRNPGLCRALPDSGPERACIRATS